MIGLLGIVLVPQRPPGAMHTMVHIQVPATLPTHLLAGEQAGSLLPKHNDKLLHGAGMPLLPEKAQLLPDCLHQLQEEGLCLSGDPRSQELPVMILVANRGRQMPGLLKEV